ncbi:MFS transporter [Serratia liquefaciens]|uniref:MFS transporter n=1 Tax=Serratia liquefaciens TaxID=614 RepID=UPI0035255EB9
MNKQSVTDIVDQSPIGGLQIMTLLLCFIVLMINGLDASAMGYIAPELAQEWGIDRAELGPAFAAGLFGMLLGSFICGPAADRYGRKTVLLICSVIVALGTLGYAFSSSITVLVALRLLTGMGLGGVLPGCITLVSEYSPIRWRMLLVTLSFSGFTLGMALGGWVADLLLPVLGWRGLLFVGSIAPLVMLPVLYFMLPESICFLANRPQQKAKLLRIVERIGGHRKWQDVIFTDGMDRKPGEKNLQLSPVAALFSEGRTERTLLLWLTFFCCLFSFYLLSNWLPTVLRSSGFDARMALYVAAMLPLGGMIGGIITALLIDRIGIAKILPPLALLASVALLVTGSQLGSSTHLLVCVFFVGFTLTGALNNISILSAGLYPTTARATGVSWGIGVGHVGSITGAYLGSWLYTVVGDLQNFFYWMAIPALIAALALFCMTRRKDLFAVQAGS